MNYIQKSLEYSIKKATPDLANIVRLVMDSAVITERLFQAEVLSNQTIELFAHDESYFNIWLEDSMIVGQCGKYQKEVNNFKFTDEGHLIQEIKNWLDANNS